MCVCMYVSSGNIYACTRISKQNWEQKTQLTMKTSRKMFESYFNEFESLVKATDKKVDQINRVDSASGDDLLAVLKVSKSYRVSDNFLQSFLRSLLGRAPPHLLSVC